MRGDFDGQVQLLNGNASELEELFRLSTSYFDERVAP